MWLQLVIDSLRRPRGAAQQVLALDLPQHVLLLAAAATSCVGILAVYLALVVSPGPVDPVSAMLLANPLLGAVVQFLVLLAVVGLTARVGAIFKGTGDLQGALALVVWLNVMMLILQMVQLAAMLALPVLVPIIWLVTLFWALWAFANFVAELHGFGNPFLVLGGVLVTLVVLLFGISILLAILGISPRVAG